MASVSSGDVVNVFKKVYGDVKNLLPEDFPLAKAIPFSEKQKVGEKYVEAVVLTNETGITLGGSTMDAVELNPARAGVVKQTEVTPFISVLPSVVPWGVISRSVGAGDKAFFDATKFIVKNNLRSHGRFQEIIRLYGQAPALLGYVSFATATYRGVSFTTGTGTLILNGTSIALTNGVNTTSKWILASPGQFAAGIWVGMEGVKVNQVDSTGLIVGSGSLVAVDAKQGAIQVDFTPIAATSTTSHRLCFDGMESAKEYIGMNKVLTTTAGTLFGINNTSFSLYQPNYLTLAAVKLTLARFQAAIADVVNRGGLEGDLDVYVNPRVWANLASTEGGLRIYDSSYKPAEAQNGFEAISFYTQAGKATFRPHRVVKEGEAYALYLSSWSRSGSAEVSFTVPGMNEELIFPLQNQTAYAFRSYSDQYLFCQMPSWNLLIDGINDESTT